MKHSMLLLSISLLSLIFLSIQQEAFSYVPTGEIKHEFIKPWHQMFIENDPIQMNITVHNDLNVTKNYVVELTFQSMSNPELSDKRIFVRTLSSLEENTFLHRTNLTPGQWTLTLKLYLDSTDCCFVNGYQTWIVIQPVQDYYNLLTAIGTILGSSAAIIAVVLQAWSNRKNLVESRKERNDTLEEMGKQREISSKALDLTNKEFESTIRPWIGAEKGLIEFGKDKLAFYYINYGKLPSVSNKIRGLQSNEEIIKDELKAAPDDTWPFIGMIMPNQIKAYVLALGDGELDQIKNNQKNFWVGFLLDYQYADNKHGEYGVIYEFFTETQKFTIRNEWIV